VGRNRNRTRIPGRLHARRLDVQSDVLSDVVELRPA
jgi:hypothetical protein